MEEEKKKMENKKQREEEEEEEEEEAKRGRWRATRWRRTGQEGRAKRRRSRLEERRGRPG